VDEDFGGVRGQGGPEVCNVPEMRKGCFGDVGEEREGGVEDDAEVADLGGGSDNGIHPAMLKALDIVGLSWLTRFFNVALGSGTVPLDWQTSGVIPIFKKKDHRVLELSWCHTTQPPRESLCLGAGKEAPTVGRTSDYRRAVDWLFSRVRVRWREIDRRCGCSSQTGAAPDRLGEEEELSLKANLSIYWSVYVYEKTRTCWRDYIS